MKGGPLRLMFKLLSLDTPCWSHRHQTCRSWLMTHGAWVHSPTTKTIPLNVPWKTLEFTSTKQEDWLLVTRPSLGRISISKQVLFYSPG